MHITRFLFALLVALLAVTAQADITELTFSPTTIHHSDLVTVTPTIPSVPEGKVYVCWNIYSDIDCTQEIDTIAFSNTGLSSNAVMFPAPEDGYYYVKCTLRTEGSCNGLVDTYHIGSLAVVPVDETPTGMFTPAATLSIRKRIIDGHLYIVKDGKIYDARGVRVE